MGINTIGLLLTFILLIFLIFKGWNIWIISIISTLFFALTNNLNIEKVIFETYSSFFKNFVGDWFLLFILSSIFGKIMEKSGAAVIIAKSLASKIEEKRAVLIILIITFILSYGGINIFVIVFSVYPICLVLFSKLNIPKEVCPGLILAIPASITMVVFPGTPSIQNTIPTKYFGTTIYSAPFIGILTSIFIFLCDYYFYSYVIKKLKKMDKKFILDDGSQIELFSFPNPPQRVTNPEACGLRHLAFKVDNIDEYVAYLLENSINCEPIRVDELTGMKYTFFRDPDYLPIELYENNY